MAKRKRFGRVVAPALLLSLGMAPLSAHALGLGKLRVSSALGQPLSARIDLVGATAAEAEIATVSLASAEAHQRMGIGTALGGVTLGFEVKVGGDGRPYVAVTSHQPVREPYIEFVVEAISPTGQVARHYIVLLDPIGTPATAAPVGRLPAAVMSAAQAQPTRSRPRANPFANVGAPKAGTTWGPVPPGATLWSIARRVKPSGADVDEVMSAIQRANPDAFINGDPARLLAGSRLTIPPADALRAPVDSPASTTEGAPQESAPAPAQVPPAGTSTRAETPAADPAATPEAELAKSDSGQPKGEVRVLRGEDAAVASQSGAAPSRVSESRVQLLEEALEAAQQQNASLDVRLKALEEQIRTLSELALNGAPVPLPSGGDSAVVTEPSTAAQGGSESMAVAPEVAPAAPEASAAAAPEPAAPTVSTPVAPAQATDEPSSGSRFYVLAAAAGAGLAGLVLWARRRREATTLALQEDVAPVAQAEVPPDAPPPTAAAQPATPTPSPTVAATSAASSAASVDDGFGDPVDTQIDLLTAYVGMADGPSARQIYDEIQRTGNAAQKAQAAALLARLDA